MRVEHIIERGIEAYNGYLTRKSAVDRVNFAALAGNGANPNNVKELFARQTGEVDADTAAAIYSSSPLAHSQIKLAADLLSCVPLKVYQTQRNGQIIERTTGYPAKILQYVNPQMGISLLLRHTVSWLKMNGQHYWAVEEAPPEYRQYTNFFIYPLNPRWTKLVPDPDTGILGAVYRVGGDKLWIPSNRLLHFMNFNPFDYWTGHSDFNPLTYDMQIERFAKKQLRNKFSSGTVIDGVVSIDDELDDDEVKKLKRQFKEQHEGARNAHRIMVLTKGMTFMPVNAAPPDPTVTSVLNGPIADDHAMVLGTPLPVLTANGPDIPSAKMLMWENNIIPVARLIEEVASKCLAQPQAGPNSFCAFDYTNVMALRLADLDRARVEVAHVNGGLKTPNEIRRERGLTPYTGEMAEFGDTPFPLWQTKMQAELAKANNAARLAMGAQASPSLSLPGTLGGRDQGSNGEAEMADETGKR